MLEIVAYLPFVFTLMTILILFGGAILRLLILSTRGKAEEEDEYDGYEWRPLDKKI